MAIEQNTATFLMLARKVGLDRATQIIHDMMAEKIIKHYKITSVKQLDPKNKVQFLMTKEHRKITIDYLSRAQV